VKAVVLMQEQAIRTAGSGSTDLTESEHATFAANAAISESAQGVRPLIKQESQARRLKDRQKPNYAIRRRVIRDKPRGDVGEFLKTAHGAVGCDHQRPVPSLPRLVFIERWRPHPDDIDEMPPFGGMPR
jgi:hypothetical protein